MNANLIVERIESLFHGTDQKIFANESGLTYDAAKDVKRIGYCVNLTLETVEEAKLHGVDMVVTHHPAWDEIYGLKEACLEKLAEYGISHYYNHLPLDDCEFGTNDSLVNELNLKNAKRTHEWEGLYFGRVAEYEEPIAFNELVKTMETLLEEPVKAWRFNDKPVNRVGILCGNGGSTECMKEAVENACDVYITGESDLYTIQYAQLKEINLIVGSHTFTELFGVRSLAMKLKESVDEFEMVEIKEKHYEANSRYEAPGV